MGRLGDGLTIKDDGGTYVTVISSNGSSEYHRGTVKNFIKMGIWLPKKDINESNDFDWVGDTDGYKNEDPKLGDMINVVYIGPRDQSAKNFFLSVLGKYRRPFKLGVFGENIRGEVIEIGSKGYVLKEINTGYEIYIPSPEHIEKQKEKAKKRVQKRGIPKLNFKFDFEFYHIIEPNSEPSVNESDDFDWAKDVQTNRDIAKDIVGETSFWMEDGSLRINLPFMSYYKGYPAKQLFRSSSLLKDRTPTIMFLEYVKKHYGFERTDYVGHYNIDSNVSDIWFKYKNLITEKIVNFMDQQ
jgi:hypothetical protein